MNMLAKDEKTIFLGYGTKFGLANKTLTGVNLDQILETPLAENLMTGLAIGLSLEGFKPVLFFERYDFMLDAIDSIANHMDKMKRLSDKQYSPRVIIRAGVGSRKPLDSGITHSQNFTEPFKQILKMPIYEPKTPKEVLETYLYIKNRNYYTEVSAIVVEPKELYKVEDEVLE